MTAQDQVRRFIRDPLFLGATRPPMRWGVTYVALLLNLVVTMEIFLLTKNLLFLGIFLPLHGLSALLCARDPRIFDLLMLWARTHAIALAANGAVWGAARYSPLPVAPPNPRGRRPRKERSVVMS
jgi:type IV secretion system protein VirB3